MTFNYFIQCPVCNTVTRMRSPAGYIYRTPVRVHCGKCNTLLTGYFISDNDNGKTYFEPKNCKEVSSMPYDYYGEASGELLCKKITYLPDEGLTIPPFISPAMSFLMSIENEERDSFIDFATHLSYLSESWDEKRIPFDLIINNSIEYLKDNYRTTAENEGYDLDSANGILCYYYYLYFCSIGGVFTKKSLVSNLRKINYEINHLNKLSLLDFISYLQGEDRLFQAQKRMFEIMDSFIGISSYVTPAIGAMRYKEPGLIDKQTLGISTCSFNDIKAFYQNAYEILADFCDIIIGLDNTKYRSQYESFTVNLNMEEYRKQSKGNRIKRLSQSECFSSIFSLRDDSNELRNAIGHSDTKYNGVTQIIEYRPNSQNPSVIRSTYLLDVAMQCVELMRSSIMLSMVVYKLLFLASRVNNTPCQMHPIFYSGIKGYSRCPCGSGVPYRQCCKPIVSRYKKGYKMSMNKHYANTELDMSGLFNMEGNRCDR